MSERLAAWRDQVERAVAAWTNITNYTCRHGDETIDFVVPAIPGDVSVDDLMNALPQKTKVFMGTQATSPTHTDLKLSFLYTDNAESNTHADDVDPDEMVPRKPYTPLATSSKPHPPPTNSSCTIITLLAFGTIILAQGMAAILSFELPGGTTVLNTIMKKFYP